MSRVKRRYRVWLTRMAARGKGRIEGKPFRRRNQRDQRLGSGRGALDVELFHSDFRF